MSKEFIEKKIGAPSIHLAVRQQEQLSYLLTSEIQENFHIDYFKNYAERNYQGNDEFLNWVKGIFKKDNYLSFVKYFRNPNPAAELIHTRIKEPLSRVFFSEDSYFRYVINGKSVDYPAELDDDFEKKLFDTLLFRHNDIIIHDLSDVNTPYRKFLCMDKVVSIKADEDTILKLAYTAKTMVDGREVKGYAYLDAENYRFYDDEYTLLVDVPHDLGKCPATFVSKESFGKDPVVRQSLFSYLRGKLEEYVFLKTLQRMTDPNGAIPVAVMLKTKKLTEDGNDFDSLPQAPMSAHEIGSQVAKDARGTAKQGEGSELQVGSIIDVPAIEKADGSIDMEVVKNFITFYRTPVESMEYLKKRLIEIEQNIITASIGDHSEGNEMSMTEKQVQRTFVSREDKLRWVSNSMSWARQNSDYVMLALAHGKDKVLVDTFYGSDFFWETPDKLYEMFTKSPNGIERKNILARLAKRRNMFNKEKSRKEVILYQLMPYASDVDFKLAVDNQAVDPLVFQLQSRFDYWINLFEGTYGSIVAFWNSMDVSEAQKIVFLTNLLINLIQKNGKEVSGAA